MFDFSKRARVSIKRQILKPKVKVHSKIAKMFEKKPFTFIWNIHPRSKEMLIRSVDSCIFYFVNVDLRVTTKVKRCLTN